jgi:hypothetical protein
VSALLVLIGVSAVAVGVAVWFVAQVVWANRVALHRKVIVNLVGDRAISGVLWCRRGGLVVLKQAELHEPGAGPVRMDGDVLIERSRVDFVQVAG